MASPMQYLLVLAIATLCSLDSEGWAQPFTSSYTDGGSWNALYGQGFNAFVNDDPGLSLEFGAPITLSRFEFFKSGNVDEASDIRLAIVNNFFLNLEDFTTSSAELVGLSSNTLATTANIITGDPVRFEFDELPLNFGDYYGAIFVNEDEAGNLTPVLVSALHTNYIETEPGSGVYLPESNYDFDPDNPTDYLTSTSNFLNTNEFGTFLVGFDGVGDANFAAYFNYTFPELDPADFDEDGDVDGEDLVDWQRNYGPFIGADADLDGDSDGHDFLLWQKALPPAGGLQASGVPEPSSMWMVSSGLLLLVGGVRRKSR